jgi:hypothetical protein
MDDVRDSDDATCEIAAEFECDCPVALIIRRQVYRDV